MTRDIRIIMVQLDTPNCSKETSHFNDYQSMYKLRLLACLLKLYTVLLDFAASFFLQINGKYWKRRVK